MMIRHGQNQPTALIKPEQRECMAQLLKTEPNPSRSSQRTRDYILLINKKINTATANKSATQSLAESHAVAP